MVIRHKTNGLLQVKDPVFQYETKMMYAGSALYEALKPKQAAND
jgi:hypothetical protein